MKIEKEEFLEPVIEDDNLDNIDVDDYDEKNDDQEFNVKPVKQASTNNDSSNKMFSTFLPFPLIFMHFHPFSIC